MDSHTLKFPGKLKHIKKITCNEDILEALSPVPHFGTRDEIKPWVHEKLDGRGINLVIERSDTSKVVFKCKNLYRKSSQPKVTTTKLINGKQVTKRVKKQSEDSCPFRLRVSFSVKMQVWVVSIIKPDHSTSLCSNFGHDADAVRASCSTRSTITSVPEELSPASSGSLSPLSSMNPFKTDEDFGDEFQLQPAFKKARLRTPVAREHHEEIYPLDTFNPSAPTRKELQDTFDFIYSSAEALNQQSASTAQLDSLGDISFANSSISELSSYDTSRRPTHFSQDQFLDTPSPSELETSATDLPSPASSTLSSEHMIFQQPNLLQDHHGLGIDQKNSLNIKNAEDYDIEDDPLMYLLSANATNGYSFEELENLDKAMGVDANDKMLLSSFQAAIY